MSRLDMKKFFSNANDKDIFNTILAKSLSLCVDTSSQQVYSRLY